MLFIASSFLSPSSSTPARLGRLPGGVVLERGVGVELGGRVVLGAAVFLHLQERVLLQLRLDFLQQCHHRQL
jgi:hypothetical protein